MAHPPSHKWRHTPGILPAPQHGVLPARDLGLKGLPRLIDALACRDGRVRLFFGTGSVPSALSPQGLEAVGAIAGGVMVTLQAGAGALPLLLSDGTRLTIEALPPTTAMFDGQNALLLMRLGESPAQLAEGMIYHAQAQGAEAALVINRNPGAAGAAFAAELAVRLAGRIALQVLDLPVPMGKPDLGPETHPFLAPDAPGKDRMAPPAPDPWQSPLGEGILYEAMKWRALGGARAVVSLEAHDLLAPRTEGGPSVFDRAIAARRGVIQLIGRRTYPWRLREEAEARFGDHICRAFDATSGNARWAVAPGVSGLGPVWRQTRVGGVVPGPADVARFYRAMALRVLAEPGMALVPKTALIEDAALLALATGPLGANPVRAPASSLRPASGTAPAGRTAIVTTMKNEAPFILEWIAHHRAIGVDDFLIYTNDCTDGTDTLLALLQDKGLVQHRDNPFRQMDLKPQHAALQAAEAEPVMADCGWAICMDVDEFLNVKIGDGTLAALYAAMGEANMISATWRLFGNAEVRGYEDRFLMEQFIRCAPEVIRKPHQAWGFKTLFRNIDVYKKLGVHRPKGLRPDLWEEVRWLTGSGQPMPREMFRNGWRSTAETYGYDWVQLNHYAVRSAESFLVKRDRGRVNHVDRDQGMNYWFRMNHNVDADLSIQRMIPRARAEWDRLMADPQVRTAHEEAVEAHRARVAALQAIPAQNAFYAELTSPRMEKLCRMQSHFGSAVFKAGPAVVPDAVIAGPIAPDFFFTVEFDGEAEH